MKNLLYSLCVGLCFCASVAYGAGEVISVNAQGTASSAIGGDSLSGLLTDETLKVANKHWNNIGDISTTLSTLKGKDGVTVSGASLTATTGGRWKYTAGGGLELENREEKIGKMADGYADGAWNIELKEIPYSTYDVVFYMATDNGDKKWNPVKVVKNSTETSYTYAANATGNATVGNATWGTTSYNATTGYAYGTNVMRITGLSGNITINTGVHNPNRGGLSGFQIVNTGTFLTKTWTAAPIGAGPHQLSTILAADGHQGEAGAADTFTNLTITLDPGATLNIDTNATLGLLKIVSENLNGAAVTITQGESGSIANIGKVDCSAITGTFTTPDLPGYPQSVTFTVPTTAAWNGVTKPTTAERATPTATTAYGLNAAYAQTINGKVSVVVNFTGATGKPEVFGGVNSGTTGVGTKDIWLKVMGGTYKTIVGGSDARDWGGNVPGSLTGNVLVDMTGGTADYVFGGTVGDKGNPILTGNIAVVIEDSATVNGSVIAVGYAKHILTSKCVGTSTVTVKNVQSTNGTSNIETGDCGIRPGYIVGGGAYSTNTESKCNVEGSTSILVELAAGKSGSFEKKLIGGGLALHGIENRAGQQATVSGKSSVSVTAPATVTFAQKIVGGGYATGLATVTTGSSEVTLNGGTYTNEIIGGGVGTNSTSGAATVTLASGNFSAATVKPGVATTSTLNITGDVTINTLEPFTAYTIAAGKTLTVNTADLSASEALVTLKKGATGTLTLGTKRNVTFAGFDGGTVSVTTDTTVTTATFTVAAGVTDCSNTGFLLNGSAAKGTIASNVLTLTTTVVTDGTFTATLTKDAKFSDLIWKKDGMAVPFVTIQALSSATLIIDATANATLTVDAMLTVGAKPVTIQSTGANTLTVAGGTLTVGRLTVAGTVKVATAETLTVTSLALSENAKISVGTWRPSIATVATNATVELIATVAEIVTTTIAFPTTLTSTTLTPVNFIVKDRLDQTITASAVAIEASNLKLTLTPPTWTATGTNDTWNTADHWTGGNVPTAGSVVIDFGNNTVARTLTIDAATDLNLDTLVVKNMGTGNNIVLGQNVTVQALEMVSASGKTLTVNCGTFAFTVANGSSPTTIALNGGTLRKLGAGSLTLDHTTVTQGAMAFIGGATTCTAATFGVSGNEGKSVAMTLNGGTLTIGTLTLANATEVTVSAATSEIACNITNNGGFTKKGTGTLTYSGVMSGNGKLDVAAGKLILTAVNTRPATEHTASATTLVSSGATLEILSNATLNDKGRYHNSPVTVEGTLTISNFTYGGALGALTDNDDKFILRGGTLNIQETTSTTRGIKIEGTASTIQMAEGKTLTIPTTNKIFKVDAPLTLIGAGNVIIAHTITGTGALTLAGAGTVAFNSTAAVPNAITVNKGATIKGTANLSGAVTVASGAKIDASANELRLTNTAAPTIEGTVTVALPTTPTESTYLIKCNGANAAGALNLSCVSLPVTLAVTPITSGTQGYKLLAVIAADLPKPEGSTTGDAYTVDAMRELKAIAAANGLTSVTSVTAITATGKGEGSKKLTAGQASDALGCFSNIASASGTTIAIVYDFGISALVPTTEGWTVTAAVQGASGTSATFADGVTVQLYAEGNTDPIASTKVSGTASQTVELTVPTANAASFLNKVLTVKATKLDSVP